MSGHAILAPSSAPVWGHCSGSVPASVGRIETPNERTIQGTAAHWVMEQCAKNWRSSQVETDLFCADWIGKVDPDGTVITEEIAEGAQFILDDLLMMARQFGGYRYLLIEQRVHMTQIHPTLNWGTLDLSLYNPDRKVLVLSDLKFGQSLVRAKGNLQMIDYVEGLYEAFAIPLDTEVHIRVIQPFAYAPWGPVDVWVCKLADLVPYFVQLRNKAHESQTDPKLTAGEHCRYCPANVDCSAAREYLYLWGTIADMPYQFDRMSPDDQAREIDILKNVERLAKSRREALEDILREEIKRGVTCGAKTLEAVKGRLNWNEGQEKAAIAAFAQLKVDIRSQRAVTATQALQLVPKDLKPVAEQMVNTFATRKTTTQLINREDSVVSIAFDKPRNFGE